jgi:hypothetical protein
MFDPTPVFVVICLVLLLFYALTCPRFLVIGVIIFMAGSGLAIWKQLGATGWFATTIHLVAFYFICALSRLFVKL